MKISVRIDSEVYDVEVGDIHQRPVLATIDGETFEVWPDEAHHAPAQQAQAAQHSADSSTAPAVFDKSRTVSAPIPGVIISIAVKPGDAVAFGQELCIMEAMKMKNAIRASRTGQIASVCIAVGDHVHHGQVLMEYTD